jgi:hypothetical protein
MAQGFNDLSEQERFIKEQEAIQAKREARENRSTQDKAQYDRVGKAIAQVLQTPAWGEMENIFLEHFAGAYKSLREAVKAGRYNEAAYAEATLSVLEGIYADISNKISLGDKAYKQYLGQIFKTAQGDPAKEL